MSDERKSRNFCIVLYPESEEDIFAMEYIEQNYTFAKCLHDKDTNTDGELKKSHYHYVFQTSSPCKLLTVSNHLRLPINRIEWCKNFTGAIRYLIHADDKDKYQYDFSDIVSNFNIGKYFSQKLDAEEQGRLLVEFITTSFPTYTELTVFALANGCYSELRRGSFLYRQILNENMCCRTQ